MLLWKMMKIILKYPPYLSYWSDVFVMMQSNAAINDKLKNCL